ncbi:MAG TPA: UDP-N-acetylmuramoyl-tripeptide--D-alanyl-D-alanine ligase [Opitutaceae bacterium]|nr:UDP-N-acetylmuramoyl-tripeptide--D-alanyl-D-alanine ligase [Opitutaceae bacterium]
MPTFDPAQLAAWTSGRWSALPGAPLSGFTMDTRQLRAGQVFIALETDKRDGHAFLPAAQAAGASAALVSKLNPALTLPQLVVPDPLTAFQLIAREHRRKFRGPVVGISGSAGKTSTKNLLALILGGEASGVLATEGNLNNHLGVPLTLTRLDPAVHTFAVVEAGISAPGEMAVLAGMIEPDVALITLVAPAHLEELGDIEGVARAKSALPAAVHAAGVAIFPKQCAEFAAFRELDVRTIVVEAAEVVRPSEPPKDKVYFATTQRGDSTAVALAYGAPPPLVFTFRRVSDGMAQNAALAICAALWLGVPPATIQQRIAAWEPATFRGEVRRDRGRLLYLDCYNANPASMADALDAFNGLAPASEPRLLVLGGMEELGREAAMFHRALGRSLHLRPQDFLMLIGDHAADVRTGAIENGNRAEQIQVVTSLEPVTARVADFHGAVFVKGSRRYQLEKALNIPAQEAVHA